MFSKIYVLVLIVAILITGLLTFYAYSWLGSLSSPQSIVENHNFYSNLAWTSVWLSSIILLGIANAILWKTRKLWAMWASLIFFAVFVVLHTFWLSPIISKFQYDNNLQERGISLSPFLGIIICILAAIIVFFNQFIVMRMHEKTFPPARLSENEIADWAKEDEDGQS
jgi:hypothetical protein